MEELLGKEKECVITVRGVPVTLRRKFKAYCAANDITIQDKIIDMMAQAIDEEEAWKRGR